MGGSQVLDRCEDEIAAVEVDLMGLGAPVISVGCEHDIETSLSYTEIKTPASGKQAHAVHEPTLTLGRVSQTALTMWAAIAGGTALPI